MGKITLEEFLDDYAEKKKMRGEQLRLRERRIWLLREIFDYCLGAFCSLVVLTCAAWLIVLFVKQCS